MPSPVLTPATPLISPTYGQVTIPKAAEIISTIVADPNEAYDLVIGTDSQNFDNTKMVVVIALHHIGHGGIFFYNTFYVGRITNVGQKLYYETQISLECAQLLINALESVKAEKGFDYENLLHIGIHVDAGLRGPSCKVIPEIVGWVTSCGYDVVVKPDSYAASSVANKFSK